MAFGLTDEGFNRKRLVDIKEELIVSLQAVFGDNIDTSDQSVIGQVITIFGEALADQWESQENIYNSQYPSTASDTSLSNVVQYNGIERDTAEFSTIETVTITGLSGTTIPIGSQASVEVTGDIFETDTAVVIGGGGTVEVSMTAIESGSISAAIDTLTVIETPLYGWVSVTNDTAAIEGENYETDSELRERRTSSVAAGGQNLDDALFGQLLEIDGVLAAEVIDNKTDSVDIYGVPAHSFECIVQVGTSEESEIVAAIWANTPIGILSHGNTTVVIQDAQGYDQDVSYSEPTDIPIYFEMDITVLTDTFPATGEADIKTAIVNYGEETFSIGDDVIYHSFFEPINETPGITEIDLYMGLSASPTGTSNISVDRTELSSYDIADIIINITYV